MLRACLPTLLLCLAGALAGLVTAHFVPVPLRDPQQCLDRTQLRLTEPRTVSPTQWLSLPRWHADFDLHCDLELGEHTELDFVLRQVEPRQFGIELPQFHGRFAVLRLSGAADGPAFLDREAALERIGQGGLRLAPGVLATVSVQARGRMVRANVAGRWTPWQRTDDVHGMTTLIARGGPAVVHRLTIQNYGLPGAWRWHAGFWIALGALAGLFQALVVRAGGQFAAAAGTLATAWLLGAVLPGLPLAWPELPAMAAALAVATLVGLLVAPGLGRARPLVALALVLLAPHLGALLPAKTPRLDALFGPQSGAMPSEALAQRVRGPFAVHVPDGKAPVVFLLGGQQLYDRGGPAEHVEALLVGELRGRRRGPVEVPCLPTVDGFGPQQWSLFERFYRGYRPAVLVFGVGRDELALAGGRPRSSPALLAAALASARQYCAQHGASLVLCSDGDLPAAVRAVLAAVPEVPWVQWPHGATPQQCALQLAEVVAEGLPKVQ